MLDKPAQSIKIATSETLETLRDMQRWGVEHLYMDSSCAQEELPVCAALDSSIRAGTPCRAETLEEIRADLGNCQRCPLGRTRHNLVFGGGNPKATLVFVGEGPGRKEDEQGEPFVGEAGQLFDNILFAMGLTRDAVYICNVIKCRTPHNRDPEEDEIAACAPFLKRQLDAINPQVLVALGKFAAHSLLQDKTPISNLRGEWRSYNGIDLMPTFHPAYLLHNPEYKREMWQDMKQVLQRLRSREI
ncbi:MAG: uracil-DNA glycosylase [Desulfuromonadaceae bacterium]|nr:uracil-DNA glycosylase [Desulfuromonadaceae bacterium]